MEKKRRKSMIKSTAVRQIAKASIPILKRNGVVKAGIFGSYARGEEKKKSDVDILVDIKKKMSLFDFVGIKLELEDKLRRKVDLVEYDTIKSRIKERILEEEVRIL
tara:strand:+ start:510 stop:827 length:318 start_codon:yes stop_codon:yes gene_type:complete